MTELMKIISILLFNYIAIQSFPVFSYDGSLDHSEGPSFASLAADVKLPDNFIVCSSSKEATFNEVGIYSIFGDEYRDWLTVLIWPLWEAIKVTVYWDREFHLAGDLDSPKLDHWYHICLKVDLSKTEIEFALNGAVLGRAVGRNITNIPTKLNMKIGMGQNNRQFHGSVANIRVFKEGDIKEISATPCKKRRGTLLSWSPQVWKVEGSHWLLIEEHEKIICAPYEQYTLAIPSKITVTEGLDICVEKLKNSFIPYPENRSALLEYVAWHQNITGNACPYVWTPLSDQNSEGIFLNMNNNSTVQYQNWDKNEPNGGKKENYAMIDVQTAALHDVGENRLFCSTCLLSSSLLLTLDGVCKDSFIGNLVLPISFKREEKGTFRPF